MTRETPVIFIMFAIVLLAAILYGVAWYYGETDWTWMAQQNTSMVLVLIVLGTGLFVLVGWLRRR